VKWGIIRLLYYLPMERMTPDTIDFNSLSKKQLVELVITKYNDCFRLEEENKKLKENYTKLDKVASENVRTLDELEAKRIELEEENKRLEEENKKLREELSAYDREYFDEDKKAENIFMEEDTLQELRDLGEI
jgi:predicted RNase H-like nuclease (RuvC/YqgF family)